MITILSILIILKYLSNYYHCGGVVLVINISSIRNITHLAIHIISHKIIRIVCNNEKRPIFHRIYIALFVCFVCLFESDFLGSVNAFPIYIISCLSCLY